MCQLLYKYGILLGVFIVTLCNPLVTANSAEAWLGVASTDISFSQLAELNLEYGVQIIEIVENSPAAQSELKIGDVIFQVDGRPIYSSKRLRWIVQHMAVGSKIQILYKRAGKVKKTKVQLAALEQGSESLPFSEIWQWPLSNTFLGAEVQDMPSELREYFGVQDDIGVLVTQVLQESPAHQVGLKVGDVITKMDRKTIKTTDDVYQVLDYFEPDDNVVIEVIRKKQKLVLECQLVAHPDAPYEPPEELLDPQYWGEELRDLMDQLQHYWRQLRERGISS